MMSIEATQYDRLVNLSCEMASFLYFMQSWCRGVVVAISAWESEVHGFETGPMTRKLRPWERHLTLLSSPTHGVKGYPTLHSEGYCQNINH